MKNKDLNPKCETSVAR